jgi:hypothetical protein
LNGSFDFAAIIFFGNQLLMSNELRCSRCRGTVGGIMLFIVAACEAGNANVKNMNP